MQQEQKDKMKYHDFTSKYKREEKEKKPVAKKFYFKERRLVLVECIPTVYTLMLYECHEKPARPSSRTIYKWKKKSFDFRKKFRRVFPLSQEEDATKTCGPSAPPTL